MKPLGVWQLALVYAGCFLGAGYLSGQELWLFFGHFGMGGVWGVLLSAFLQCALCIILLSLARRGEIERVEHAVIRRERHGLREAVGVAEICLLFCVAVIMSAGVGALAAQLTGIGGAWASLLFCAGVLVLSRRGMSGLVRLFTRIVPMLMVASLIVSFAAACRFDGTWQTISQPVGEKSMLLPHWAISAVVFVSCNLFGSIAVLLPLSRLIPNRAVARRGALLGAGLLLLVACAILIALYLEPACVAYEMPMLALAEHLHPFVGTIFALLLLGAMFGTALSCTVAVREQLSRKYPICQKYPTAAMGVFVTLVFGGGLLGFGNLIGVVYPLFGYFGLLALCGVVSHERYLRRRDRRDGSDDK